MHDRPPRPPTPRPSPPRPSPPRPSPPASPPASPRPAHDEESPPIDPRARARLLLDARDDDAAAAGAPPAAVRRALLSLLFDPDALVRWRAGEALGRAAAALARRDGLEPARNLIRRALWLMNDESGGLLWQGPPLVAAILARSPQLGDEFAPILASLLDEEPFRAGTRWALWRLAGLRPRPAGLDDARPALLASLADPDPAVRGHAALALRALAAPDVPPALATLADDPARLEVFDPRRAVLLEVSVGALATGRVP